MPPTRQDGGARAAGAGANWVLALVISTTALTGVALSIMIVAFPAIIADFSDTSIAQLSWISNLFTIVSAAVIVPCGVLADRFGRRRMMLVGSVLFTAGSLIGGLAPSPGWIMVARTVLALGAASFGPAGMAMLVSAFPPERMVFAISIWSISGGAAAAAGPALGGVLVDGGGWRWAFWINLPLCVATLVIARFVRPDGARDPSTRLPDPLGALLVMAATSAVTLAVVQRKSAPGWGWLGAKTWASVAVGVLLGVAFVVRCRRSETPLVRLELLRSAEVKIGALGMFVQNIAFFAPYWALVQHTINQWGWSAARAGLASVPVSLVSGAVAFATSRIADRSGPRPFVLTSAFGQLIAFAVVAVWIGDEPSLLAVILSSTLLGATSGLAVPSLASMALRGLPGDQRALGSAVNSMAQRIGATLGAALAITFVASEVGTGALRNTLVACAVAAAVTIPLGVRSGSLSGPAPRPRPAARPT